jgi:hypothetical protein
MPEFVTTHWWERFLHNRVEGTVNRIIQKTPEYRCDFGTLLTTKLSCHFF